MHHHRDAHGIGIRGPAQLRIARVAAGGNCEPRTFEQRDTGTFHHRAAFLHGGDAATATCLRRRVVAIHRAGNWPPISLAETAAAEVILEPVQVIDVPARCDLFPVPCGHFTVRGGQGYTFVAR